MLLEPVPSTKRKRYPESHWIRSHQPERILNALMDQQSKAYSRVKNRFIKELLGDLSGKRFLDVGCGAGLFLVHAAQSGALAACGVDPEWSVLSAARVLCRRNGLDRGVSLLAVDGVSALCAAAAFDVVLLKDVLEHVREDRSLLRDISAITAPGGILVLSTQNAWSLNYLIEGTCRRRILRQRDWYGWDPTHIRFYTPSGLRNKLHEAGFECIQWRSIYLVPYKLPLPAGASREFLRIDALSWIDRLMGRVAPFNRLGWNLIVKVQKRV